MKKSLFLESAKCTDIISVMKSASRQRLETKVFFIYNRYILKIVHRVQERRSVLELSISRHQEMNMKSLVKYDLNTAKAFSGFNLSLYSITCPRPP